MLYVVHKLVHSSRFSAFVLFLLSGLYYIDSIVVGITSMINGTLVAHSRHDEEVDMAQETILSENQPQFFQTKMK